MATTGKRDKLVHTGRKARDLAGESTRNYAVGSSAVKDVAGEKRGKYVTGTCRKGLMQLHCSLFAEFCLKLAKRITVFVVIS